MREGENRKVTEGKDPWGKSREREWVDEDLQSKGWWYGWKWRGGGDSYERYI